MSNLKPKFGPKVCLAPPCQAFNLTLGQNACFALPHVKNFTPRFGPKVCLAPPCQAFNLTLGQNACCALPLIKLKLDTQIRAKGLSSPSMPSIGAKRLFCAPACQNLKPKFGPKVCLDPPCQAFNLTLGQNACFALLLVKLESQIRAKGLSSPTMPHLQPYIEQNACFALLHVNLKPIFGPKVCLAPPCQAFNLTLGQVLRSRMPNFIETHLRAKDLSSPTMPSLQRYTLGQSACFALPHIKLEIQIRVKGLSNPTMPSLQPYIGAKRLFCAPACQT